MRDDSAAIRDTFSHAQGMTAREIFAHMAVAIILVCFAWLAAANGWDEKVTAHYFNDQLQAFPLRDSWLLKSLLHDTGKLVPVGVALLLLCIRIHGHASHSRWHGWRSDVVYALMVLLISTGIAGALKDNVPLACPWSLAEYGGSKVHFKMAAWLSGLIPAGVGAGHCWPSGHAAGAFGMIGLYFVMRTRGHETALPLLFVLVGWGALSGWAQIARGAHFISHVLWSAAICWAVAVSLLPLLRLGSESEKRP